MSILIKGMDMPTCCAKCQWLQQRFPGGKDWCKLTNKLAHETWASASLNPIPDWCPLVPVPPHGRLIDGDALEKDFREDAEDAWNKQASPISWADAFDELAGMVADAPTVIEAEEGE